ncbi:hypothetical protein J3R82DRAFT_6983 [Butyriboletus roseoflavus]|nr:hypothetical protein J3R82DRAFT_6983 [Butyriboletus roseoflavus]
MLRYTPTIFLSPSISPIFPTPTSQPLRTPVKEELHSKARSVLKSKWPNAQSKVALTSAVTSAAVGTKCKSLAQSEGFLTPLQILLRELPFISLTPLPALQFGTCTLQSKAEMEAYLKGQAETMKRLCICDMENSDKDWGVIVDDGSTCEAEEQNNLGAKKSLEQALSVRGGQRISCTASESL